MSDGLRAYRRQMKVRHTLINALSTLLCVGGDARVDNRGRRRTSSGKREVGGGWEGREIREGEGEGSVECYLSFKRVNTDNMENRTES